MAQWGFGQVFRHWAVFFLLTLYVFFANPCHVMPTCCLDNPLNVRHILSVWPFITSLWGGLVLGPGSHPPCVQGSFQFSFWFKQSLHRSMGRRTGRCWISP